ncbi:MAG: hypothetical protein M3R25_13390 [Bacteroidota bacterium]|nr:hypothetical protein [Bacteroidota bacterium]
MKYISTLVTIISLFMIGCQETSPTPKPRAYPKIEFPERKYRVYEMQGCPVKFEYPSYAQIKPKEQACWFDLVISSLNARIHCSYIQVNNREGFDDLVGDAFVIADKINERSNYMEQALIGNDHDVNGLMFIWTGPAASPVHFFLSDTMHHFFKAALYFDSKVNPDSLAPISAFIREDINHMITSFEWKTK